jgi:hypothetical protein
MANEFIDNIVAQKAFDQVNDMRKALADLQAQYAQLIQVINSGITAGNRGASTRLTEEAKIQAEILRTKERIVALDSVASSGNKLGQELNDVKQDLKDINKELKNTNVISDSLAGMRLELAKLEKQYTLLGKAARESTGGQQMLKDLQAQQTAVSNLEQQMGNYKRNVGNYSNATFQLSQSLRELPAFAFSAQTGILALSNNLPMLVDSFNEVKKSAGGAGNALAIFAKSIFSFTNLFTIAIALFTIYYKEINRFIFGTNLAAEATKVLGEELGKGEFVTAVSNYNQLSNAVTLVAKGTMDSAEALELYNETMGKTAGKVKTWQEAEAAIISKGKVWLEYMQLKTEMQIFYNQAAVAGAAIETLDFAEPTAFQKFMQYFHSSNFDFSNWGKSLEEMNKRGEQYIEKSKNHDRVLLEDQQDFYNKLAAERQAKMTELQIKYDFTHEGDKAPKSSKKEVNRIEELKKQYENELLVADTAYKKGELGYMQHQWRIVEITEEFARKRLNAIQKLSKKESDSRVQLENDMISNLTKATTDIGETGVQAIHKLAKERGKDFADEYIKGLKESIKNNLTAEGQAAAVNWFNTMVAGAKPPNLSNIGEGGKQTSYDRNKLLEEYIMYLGAAQQILGALNDLSSTLLDRDMAALDLKIEKQQEAFDLEEEHIKQMGLSKEEEAKRLAKLEAQKGAQEKLNAQERKKIQQQEAIRNKAFAVMNIGLQTSQAIMQFLVNPGGPLGVKLSVAAGVAGGIQLAAALATPIPQFAKGTDNAPEGYAIVGEKGTELVTEPSGKQWLTPAKDTLTYLKKGSKVTTNEDLMDMVKNQAFATLATMNKPITTDLYTKVLIEKFEENTSELRALKGIMQDKNMSTQIIGNFDHYMHVKKNIR